METISPTVISGVGNGILHPKMKNRFVVLFKDAEGNDLGDWANYISVQVISTSSISQYRKLPDPDMLSAYAVSDEGGCFNFVVEDDITNRACDGLQKLMGVDSFDIHVQCRDGNDNTVRTHVLRGCQVESITHDVMDYSELLKVKKYVNVEYKSFEIV